MTAEALRRAKDVTSNVFRLMDDARLLDEHERYSSAYALAILAFEEAGKLLLILWGVPEPKKNRHVVKQRAVGALLMSHWVRKEFGRHETLDEELIERGAKALSESSPGRLSEFIEMTVLDKSKQAALYSDERSVDLDPDQLRQDAGMLLDMVIQAMGAIRDSSALEGGRNLFEVMTHLAQRRAPAVNV
jgi:AbiV family abortive infection protein